AGAFKHTAHRCAEWKRVPRLGKVARFGVLVAEQADRGGAIEGADAGGDPMSDRLDGDRECGAESRSVVIDHRTDAELVEAPPLHWHAYQAASVGGHEVDRLGGDPIGGDREIA